MKYRVNTPGPSFVVDAPSIDAATRTVVGRGFPPPHWEAGDSVTESTVIRDGREYRYLALWRGNNTSDEPDTGCVIYQEPTS